MLGPLLLAVGAVSTVVTLVLVARYTAYADTSTTAVREAAKPAPDQAGSILVSGTVTLKPNPGDPPSDVLDKIPCASVVVAATDAAGAVVASAPARAGATKGECIYSLKVPAGAKVRLGVRELKMTGSATVQKVAPVGATQSYKEAPTSGTLAFKEAPNNGNVQAFNGTRAGRAGQFDVFMPATSPVAFSFSEKSAINAGDKNAIVFGNARQNLDATIYTKAEGPRPKQQ